MGIYTRPKRSQRHISVLQSSCVGAFMLACVPGWRILVLHRGLAGTRLFFQAIVCAGKSSRDNFILQADAAVACFDLADAAVDVNEIRKPGACSAERHMTV